MKSSAPNGKASSLTSSFAPVPAWAPISAMYAHGKADFIAKLQIALKECSESEYWLELLMESGCYDNPAVLKQCTEVKRLLIASINTAKKNQK